MKERIFVPSHSQHTYNEGNKKDYSACDQYFVQSLKTMESMIDIDAYIIDYVNERVLYATQNSIIRKQNNHHSSNPFQSIDYLDDMIIPEDLKKISNINSKVYDFFYSLPIKRRKQLSFTQGFRVWGTNNKPILINHNGGILDLTENGSLRLTLCINSLPTHIKPGNSYIKMNDTKTVYEFISAAGKFVEVKTQKLTSKALSVLELASNGKTEQQISDELGITIHAVKYHKKRIFAQTGTRNTAEAIQWMNNQKIMIKR